MSTISGSVDVKSGASDVSVAVVAADGFSVGVVAVVSVGVISGISVVGVAVVSVFGVPVTSVSDDTISEVTVVGVSVVVISGSVDVTSATPDVGTFIVVVDVAADGFSVKVVAVEAPLYSVVDRVVCVSAAARSSQGVLLRGLLAG